MPNIIEFPAQRKSVSLSEAERERRRRGVPYADGPIDYPDFIRQAKKLRRFEIGRNVMSESRAQNFYARQLGLRDLHDAQRILPKEGEAFEFDRIHALFAAAIDIAADNPRGAFSRLTVCIGQLWPLVLELLKASRLSPDYIVTRTELSQAFYHRAKCRLKLDNPDLGRALLDLEHADLNAIEVGDKAFAAHCRFMRKLLA